MDTMNFEQMAREYKNALATVPTVTDSDTYLEQIITISEGQFDALDDINTNSQLCKRMINYLKNLTYQTLIIVQKLLDGTNYVPQFRNISRNSSSTAKSRLINSQIDIFILLDKLATTRTDLAELISLENRKMAILSSL
jgi:hypothetical protein